MKRPSSMAFGLVSPAAAAIGHSAPKATIPSELEIRKTLEQWIGVRCAGNSMD